MRARRPNFYSACVELLSQATVPDWWRGDYDLRKLVAAFGKAALQRGIDDAKLAGADVPPGVQEALDRSEEPK